MHQPFQGFLRHGWVTQHFHVNLGFLGQHVGQVIHIVGWVFAGQIIQGFKIRGQVSRCDCIIGYLAIDAVDDDVQFRRQRALGRRRCIGGNIGNGDATGQGHNCGQNGKKC